MSLYYFLTNHNGEKQKQTEFKLKPFIFLKTQMRITNQINKQGERVQKGMRQHCLGLEEIVCDKMGKWMTFLYAHQRRWVQTEEIAPPYTSERSVLSTGDGLDEVREVEKFLGFGFVLWESVGMKGKGEMRKEKADGDEMGFRE